MEIAPGVDADGRAGSEVGTMELFEYDSSTPPVIKSLGPDTLRIGRRVVPTVVEKIFRAGSDSWAAPGDTTHVMRPVLIQTFWRNAAVPITGFARSVFEVTMERTARDSAVAPTSEPAADAVRRMPPGWLGRTGADSSGAAAPPPITRTELELMDLGADAVPEVKQQPEESAPPGSEPPGTSR